LSFVVTSVHNAAGLASAVDVFYSYSHKDWKLRDELEKSLTMLKRDGIITGWYDRKIGGGEEWAGAIDEHINSARIILLLISADFLASDYCYDIEVKRAMERHEAGEALVIPVILRPVDWSSAPFGRLQGFPRDAKPITKWKNRDEAFKDVALGIRKVAEKLHAEGSTAGPRLVVPAATTGALPRIWNVPHSRNPNFTGREELLTQVHDSLRSGNHAALTQALHGLGGIGKTQTATEYCYLHAADYELAWWIRSEEPGKLAADYAGLANELGLIEKDAQDQRITVQAVRAALARRTRWLLVFDNARGPEDVRDYLPQGNNGHVLVTSRNPAFGSVAHPLPVPTMKTTEVMEFLLKRAPSVDETGAKALAEALGGLPLALEHAGAYVEECSASFSGYLELFLRRQKDILGRAQAPVGYEATVATTWEISFAEVEKGSEAAGQLMNLCAFLAPDDIGREMLQSGSEILPEPLAAAVSDDLQWNDAVGVLRKYSLIEVQDGAISVHRLVQAVARDRLDQEERKKWAEAAVKVVDTAFPYDDNDLQTWAPSSRLLPHALASMDRAEELQVALKTCWRLLNEVGLYLSGRAEFLAARSVHERALRICEVVFGSVHPALAVDMNNLGNVLRDLGDLAGAREHYEQALKIDELAYGPDEPDVAIDVNNLGNVLRDLGDLAGARACFERALRIQEAAYGPDHPSVAIDVSNIGSVLWDQGDLAGARACFERALGIDEAVYGPDHPGIATYVWWLGVVFRDLGDTAQARAHLERAARIFEQTLGKDHPSTQRAGRWLKGLG
jgi:tetratricopeptide (TPR) repeat protein